MVLSFGGWLIVLGILGASNLIIAKRPDAKDMIAKFAPYQGWFGALSVFYGVWELISSITSIGWLGMGLLPMIAWILFLASSLLQLSLGLLLGVGVMKTFIKNEQARAKMDETNAKLAPYRGTLGLIAIAVGVAFTVLDILAF